MKRLLIAVLALIMFSCKKSGSSTNNQNSLLQSKWLVDNLAVNDHYNGTDNKNTYTGTSADYLDFRTDMKVYSHIQGQSDTTAYTLPGNSTIIVGGSDTLQIQSLTSSIMKLYEKININTSNFTEITYNLKK